MRSRLTKFILEIDFNPNCTVESVGGKGWALLRMPKKINIPRGFIINTRAFDTYLKYNHILDDFDRLSNTKEQKIIEEKIENGKFPVSLHSEIVKSLKKYGLSGSNLVVRSSATIEDSKNKSFAGKFETIINVRGIQKVEKAIRKIYCSLFNVDIDYFRGSATGSNNLKMGIVVQELVSGEVSGVLFTKSPNSRKDTSIIEAVVGLNEGLVSGRITPSRFVLDWEKGFIDKQYIKQKIAFRPRKNFGVEKVTNKLDIEDILTDKMLYKLFETGKKIENIFGKPQDIEWTIKNSKIYVLQSRPITSMGSFYMQNFDLDSFSETFVGYPASKGIATGKVKIVREPNEFVPKDAILVVDVLETDYPIKSIKKAKAIVTQDGGMLSHAAIIARELQIPCVVGVEGVIRRLKDGDIVFVDGTRGMVYKGNKNKRDIKFKLSEVLDYSFVYDFDRIVKIPKIDVYVEEFGNKVIYYSEKELNSEEINLYLKPLFAQNKMIEYGSKPKYFIYKQYLLYKKDQELCKLTRLAIKAAKSFDHLKIESIASILLSKAKEYVSYSKKLENLKTRKEKLNCLLLLQRANWCYTLVNELICEGYGITKLDRKLRYELKRYGISMLDFVYSVDSNNVTNLLQYSKKSQKLLFGIKFYNAIKRWRLCSYLEFEKVGATGDEYYSRINYIIKSLAGANVSTDKLRIEAIRLFGSGNV